MRPPADAPAPPLVPPPPVSVPTAAAGQASSSAPVTILISIDGFRADYLDRGVTPVLSGLAARGVRASMRPSFPSITFPNYWTLVTGLRPDRSGIVGNRMERPLSDPAADRSRDPSHSADTFTMQTDDASWWNAAEPIWVSAEKAGIRTATMFWPGSNVAWGSTRKGDHGVAIGGTRPEDWAQFNQAVTGPQRVAAVIDWLRRPAATRPRLVTLYFDTVDTAGHRYGPDTPEVTAAVADVDRSIGMLVDGLSQLGQAANLVIVADHGMAGTSSMRTVALDRLADPADYRVEDTGPFASLAAVPGHEAALEARLLGAHPHVRCWRKAEIPARLHFGANPLVEPYLCLADTGWLIERTAPAKPSTGGAHGYDNAAPEMAALFIAEGPAFAAGRRLAPFDNVDVAPLVRDLIGLPPGRALDGKALDGSDAPFRAVLVRSQ
ncbi:ectonucleotide pyrophosphatase/phosphodiesterase [uncultured Sphingomonas sp.]|uniref:alkaline phosphatase family protein n=1 Tax=uncultured Sphingomonas sp. TaxID=158754 RepID=UPI0035C9D1D3